MSRVLLVQLCAPYPFLWQWRDDDVRVGDQEVCSEQFKLTVASPQSVWSSRRTPLRDSFSWPGNGNIK